MTSSVPKDMSKLLDRLLLVCGLKSQRPFPARPVPRQLWVPDSISATFLEMVCSPPLLSGHRDDGVRAPTSHTARQAAPRDWMAE